MRWLTKLLLPVLVLGVVGVADAKGKKDGLAGKIVSVTTNSITIQTRHKKGAAGGAAAVETVTVQTDASTLVTIDGVAGKSVRDLQAGERVRVTPSTGTATLIEATTKKHHKKKAA